MASSWLVVMFELQSLAMLSLLRAALVMPGGTPLNTYYHYHHIAVSDHVPDVHMAHADQPEVGAPTHLCVQSQHLARAQLGVKQVHLKISLYEELQYFFLLF